MESVEVIVSSASQHPCIYVNNLNIQSAFQRQLAQTRVTKDQKICINILGQLLWFRIIELRLHVNGPSLDHCFIGPQTVLTISYQITRDHYFSGYKLDDIFDGETRSIFQNLVESAGNTYIHAYILKKAILLTNYFLN